MKKNSYMDKLRELAGYDEFGNEIDEEGNVVDAPVGGGNGKVGHGKGDDQNTEIGIDEDGQSDDSWKSEKELIREEVYDDDQVDNGATVEGASENGISADGNSEDDSPEEDIEPPFDTTGSVECKVLLRAKDMQHFMFRHNYTSISGWFGILISIIALVMVIVGYNMYDTIQKIVLIVLALMFTVVQPIQIVLRARAQIKNQDMFHDTLTYNLCKEGLLVRQADMHVNIPWDSIGKVVYTSKAIFVYTSSVRAFIFPYDQLGDADKVKRVIKEKTGKKI